MSDPRHYLIRRAAERSARSIVRRTKALLKSDDSLSESGLKNAWQDICVQVRDQHGLLWSVYEQHVYSRINWIVSRLPRDRLWLLGHLTDHPEPDTVAEMMRRNPDIEHINAMLLGHVMAEADVCREPAVERYLAARYDS